MKLDNLVAVTGMQGIYKVVGNRNNGLIIEDLDSGKRKFAPSRIHQFSPLESISIYTYSDSTPLKEVFQAMLEHPEALPADNSKDLSAYFRLVLPEYDEDRVKVSDMRKVIKWFQYLSAKGLLAADPSGDLGEEE